MYNIKPDHYS